MLTPEIREFAQVPDRYTRLSNDVRRYADDRACILEGTVWSGVAGVRVGPAEVAALLDDVRSRVPPGKRTTWWIDPGSEPPDLYDHLLALGLQEPEDGHGVVHALACVEAPPPGPAEVQVTQVTTFADHLTAVEVSWEAFETPEDRRSQQRPHLREEFEAAQAAGVPVTFLARLDGSPAGMGRSIPSDRGVFLIAGSVVERARRRGVYRALVRARWDDAVARGTPALVVEALPDTSYPVLKRLGFVDVCTTRRLVDVR